MNDSLDETQRAARDQFGKQSHLYGAGHILENIQDVVKAMEQFCLPQGAKVLDVATGGGHTGMYFAGLGCEVTLADLAFPMLERAQAAARERGLEVAVREHPAELFPYENETFQLVACRLAAHHFSSPSDFVGEVARVLQPGGLFLLIDGTVEDGQPEAQQWIHQVDKLRDPSHHRFLTPGEWEELCERNGLAVKFSEISRFKQPDIEWYFQTAATSPDRREKVLELVRQVPQSARELFQVGEEAGKIVWWWQLLSLVAAKAAKSNR